MKFFKFEKSEQQVTVNIDSIKFIQLVDTEWVYVCAPRSVCNINIKLDNDTTIGISYKNAEDRESDYNKFLEEANKEN